MYCGDETGSFIGEIGSHTCRFGYGGEDNPKLTMPSYVVASNSTTKDSPRQNRRRMSRFSSLHPLSEEEKMESILRMPCSSNNDNGSNVHEPLIDPNQFWKQGEVVESWDNLQTAWEHSMDVLRVTDTLKHTAGGTPYDRTKKQKRDHGASGVTAASVVGKEDASERGGKCVHPVLAITPGFSELSLKGDTGQGFQAAVRRQEYTRYTELLMESLDATSVFLAPAPMLAAFSLGRQTALVVDIGAGGCRVTPIVDGFVLKQSQRRSGRGGDWLGNVTWKALLEEIKTNTGTRATLSSPGKQQQGGLSPQGMIQPRYMVLGKKKQQQSLSTPCSVFHRRAMNDLMYEIRTDPFVAAQQQQQQQSTDNNPENTRIPFVNDDGDVVMTSPPGTPASAASHAETNEAVTPGSPESTGTTAGDGETAIYELPDGTPIDLVSSSFGKDLCHLSELLFADESALPFRKQQQQQQQQQRQATTGSTTKSSSASRTLSNLPLHELIRESLLSVGDVDTRKELAACICLVGATSLLPNLDKRLSQELTALLPSFVRPKVVAPKIASVERSCASWIGASILTSLGSFQQLWLSRSEYEEYGSSLSIQRFP